MLFFSVSLLGFLILYKLIGSKYALDSPDQRKLHKNITPQIGGIVFGPVFLFIGWWLGLAPVWYLAGGLVSILLGAADDLRHIPWQVKLLIQLLLLAYLSSHFWGHFNSIIFYNYSFPVSQVSLLFLFFIWFIGIYNAVNLLDGLDGLAGGFMLLLCIGLGLSDLGPFARLNIIFSALILGFLVFNQRPAKVFMGDAGSLFLGFHIAVLPLLFFDSSPISTSLNMTPFVLLASYLVADTTRVFFTRLVAQKSPMTADTIHFHHVILQQSGSYLASIGSIYVVTLISAMVAVFSFQTELSANVMLCHLALLLLFILTPPVQTYVPIITRTVKPFYTWQKNDQKISPFLFRTLFIVILLIGLLVSLCVYSDLAAVVDWQHGLAVFLLLVFIFLHRKEKMAMYVVQLGSILLFAEVCWKTDLGMLIKLLSTLLIVSYVIFILERRTGCNISKFSSLDLLMILVSFGGMCISALGFPVSVWYFLQLLSIWFGLRFIFLRTLYLGL